MATILGIETSCDETAASVVTDGRWVRANAIASQHDLHERYGGVVPEIASRAHMENLTPIVRQCLDEAGIDWPQIDAVAVGNRPGLIGSLLVGVSAAKALAWSLGKPLIGVDHVHAHMHAASLWPADDAANAPQPMQYPALGLVVSGGHTSMYRITSPLEASRIGRTIDDAIGEAYDKAAVILDIGYPGGPRLDQLAQGGDSSAYDLPRSVLKPGSLDFSFSGLKTALLYTVRGKPVGRGKGATFERSAADLTEKQQRDMAASFQQAAIDAVMIKIDRALAKLQADGSAAKGLIVGGGVSANSLLRARMIELGQERNLPIHLPPMSYCLDNAAMIAGLAHTLLDAGRVDDLSLPAIATTSLR